METVDAAGADRRFAALTDRAAPGDPLPVARGGRAAIGRRPSAPVAEFEDRPRG